MDRYKITLLKFGKLSFASFIKCSSKAYIYVKEEFISMMMIRCIELVFRPLVDDQKRIEFAKLARLNPEAS